MLIVGLVEEDVFPITTLGRPLFQDTLLVDAMLSTQSLPVYGAHF